MDCGIAGDSRSAAILPYAVDWPGWLTCVRSRTHGLSFAGCGPHFYCLPQTDASTLPPSSPYLSLSWYFRVTNQTSHGNRDRKTVVREKDSIDTYVSGICKSKTKRPKIPKSTKEACETVQRFMLGSMPSRGGETSSRSTCRRSMLLVSKS